jgi:hypothetical protein
MIISLFLTALLQTSVVSVSEGVSLQEQKLVNASSVQAHAMQSAQITLLEIIVISRVLVAD